MQRSYWLKRGDDVISSFEFSSCNSSRNKSSTNEILRLIKCCLKCMQEKQSSKIIFLMAKATDRRYHVIQATIANCNSGSVEICNGGMIRRINRMNFDDHIVIPSIYHLYVYMYAYTCV